MLGMSISWCVLEDRFQMVYYKCHVDEHTVITISMDDMAVTSKSLGHIILFKDELKKYFEISDLGELSWLLGLKVEQNHAAHTLTLSHKAYVNTIRVLRLQS
jgi:hypothetical protein